MDQVLPGTTSGIASTSVTSLGVTPSPCTDTSCIRLLTWYGSSYDDPSLVVTSFSLTYSMLGLVVWTPCHQAMYPYITPSAMDT